MPCRRKRDRPPSLYRTVPSPRTTLPPSAGIHEVFALLNATVSGTALAERLAQFERLLTEAERDGFTEHAARLRKHLDLLERARRAGALDTAVLEAMDLGAAFERLRADARFSGPVDSYRRGRVKPITSDADIDAALKRYPRYMDAAAALGMSERQLRERRKRIAKYRKSVRPPPSK